MSELPAQLEQLLPEDLERIARKIVGMPNFQSILLEAFGGKIDMHVLPGGRKPERKSGGAAGYDVYARALVNEFGETDPRDSRLRRTEFDFFTVPESPEMQEHIIPDPDSDEKWAYILHPDEHVLIGAGFATALPYSMFYWLTPRSGLSMKRLTLTNAPGTVDADYRGEAGLLLVNNSESDFLLQHHTRIAQALFVPVLFPEFVGRASLDELGHTDRSGGGFGSTGLHG